MSSHPHRSLLVLVMMLLVASGCGWGEDKKGKPPADLNGTSYAITFFGDKNTKPETISFAKDHITMPSFGDMGIAFTSKPGKGKAGRTTFTGTAELKDGTSITIEGGVSGTGEIGGSITARKANQEPVAKNFKGTRK